MSKFCPKCKTEMPEEANFCFQCMNSYDNKTAISVRAESSPRKHRLSRANTLNRLKDLPKKQKVALAGAFMCLIALIPISLFTFSLKGTNPNQIVSAAEEYDAPNQSQSGAKAFFNKLFGIEDDNNTAQSNENDHQSASSTKSATKNGAASGSSDNGAHSNINIDNNTSVSDSTNNSSDSSNTEDDSNDNSNPVLNYNDWEYEVNSSGETVITKYTGNDENVLVPDKINGKNIDDIKEYAFSDNSSIKSIIFQDSEEYHCIDIRSNSFYNLPNLNKIVFPKNTDFIFYMNFALNTPKLTEIEIEHWQAKFIDGVFYWRGNGRDWELLVYTEGSTAETLNVPDYVSFIYGGNSISNNKYLRVLNLPSGLKYIDASGSSRKYQYLKEVNIAAGNENNNYWSVSGVVFTKSTRENYNCRVWLFPGGKADKEFTFPNNCYIEIYEGHTLSHIETICIPKSSYLGRLQDIKSVFPNLKTIKIENGNPDFNTYKTKLGNDYNIAQY